MTTIAQQTGEAIRSFTVRVRDEALDELRHRVGGDAPAHPRQALCGVSWVRWTMEWLLFGWIQSLVNGSYLPAGSPVAWPGAAPAELDLRVVELAYRVAADASRCGRCRARLGRGLALSPGSTRWPTGWRVVVTTKCRGFRRHRHHAVAGEEGGHLHLGLFVHG